MRRLLCIISLCVLTPTSAQVSPGVPPAVPSVEQLYGAYHEMPWHVNEDETLACVAPKQAQVVDYIVWQLAAHARAKVSCS